MKFRFSNILRTKYLIVLIFSIFLGFYLYSIPNIAYKYSNFTKPKIKNINTSINKSSNSEILFSPYIMDGDMSPNDVLNFTLTLGIFKNQINNANLAKLNYYPNIIAENNPIIIDNKNIRFIDKSNFCNVNINNNSIIFMYLNNKLIDINEILSYSKLINEYKKQNSFIILYINPKIEISHDTINFLANQGINLIFSPSINNTYIEKINKSIIIYGVEKNNYIPQFDIVFKKDAPISLGIRIFSPKEMNENLLNDVSNYVKNIPFKLSNKFSFIDY